MKIIQKSACALEKIVADKRIVIFGSGHILNWMVGKFSKYDFESKIDYIVDNNRALWGTTKKFNEKMVSIYSPEFLKKNITDRTVILVAVKKYAEIMEQLSGYSELKNIKVYKYPECHYKCEKIWDKLWGIMPLRKIVLMYGKGDNRENALALFEYMKNHNICRKYKVVWKCINPIDEKKERNVDYIYKGFDGIKPGIWDVWKVHYYENIAKYLFYENGMLYKKQKKQVSVYLKHGTFMLKNVKGRIVIPDEVDWVICTSINYADLAADQESVDKEKLLICGSPRLDFLYKEKNVLKTLGMKETGFHYILWLPTLRQNKQGTRNDVEHTAPYGIPLIKSEDDFLKLDECLGENHTKLIIKPHPYQNLSVYKVEGYKNIILVTQDMLDEKDFTIHSLMRETQGLISDYSSIAFDYMLLDRPIAYTVDDMEEYKIGFSVEDPFHFMPGEKLSTCDDMVMFIEHIVNGIDLYKEQRHEIRDYVHDYQDDRNAERFLKMMNMI